jgi:hypothetical protein
MESEGSLPCSQQSSSRPYPVQEQSSPHHLIICLQDPFLAYLLYFEKKK